MADPHRLRPEDRADFVAVLHLALNTADIRSALRGDPTGRAAGRLRAHALAHTDEITAEAAEPYLACLAVRATAPRDPGRPFGGHTLLPALAVLTPLVAAASAAALLALGGALRLAGAPGPLPGSLVTAGWTLTLVAAVSGLAALAGLLGTALRRRGIPPETDQAEQARLVWRQALLDHGMLPHLRRYLAEAPASDHSPHGNYVPPGG